MTFKIKGLKCLPLPDYIEFVNELHDFDIDDLIYPLVGRDGFYYHRQSKIAWMEYKGIARMYEVESFLSTLEYYDHIPLTESSRNAIKVLIQNKICPSELVEYYNNDLHMIRLREQKIQIHKLMKKNRANV
jgi:hypothetical protein